MRPADRRKTFRHLVASMPAGVHWGVGPAVDADVLKPARALAGRCRK
jgi:hypothetical protein